MDHWPFIIAAFGLTFLGTGGVCLWAFAAMRRAERRAGRLTGDR